MALARPLRRRALWRLLTEGTGRAAARALLERVLADLGARPLRRATRCPAAGRCPALRPSSCSCRRRRSTAARAHGARRARLRSPSAAPAGRRRELALPVRARSPRCRRRVAARRRARLRRPELRRASLPRRRRSATSPRSTAELDARRPAPAAALRALAARPAIASIRSARPGSRRWRASSPTAACRASERARVPLVVARAREIVWVAGVCGPPKRARAPARARACCACGSRAAPEPRRDEARRDSRRGDRRASSAAEPVRGSAGPSGPARAPGASGLPATSGDSAVGCASSRDARPAGMTPLRELRANLRRCARASPAPPSAPAAIRPRFDSWP